MYSFVLHLFSLDPKESSSSILWKIGLKLFCLDCYGESFSSLIADLRVIKVNAKVNRIIDQLCADVLLTLRVITLYGIRHL